MDQNQPVDRMPLSMPGVPQEIVDGLNQSLEDIRLGRFVDAQTFLEELRAEHAAFVALQSGAK